MKPKLLLCLALVMSGGLFMGCAMDKPVYPNEGKEIKMNTINVLTLDTFDAFGYNASVYLCAIASHEQSSTSDIAVERGKIILRVIKVLRGAKRQSINLPYGFIREGAAIYDGGTVVWPSLKDIGKSNILCVVVPNAEDPIIGKIQGVNEAASSVVVVTGENDTQVQEMETICNLYEIKRTPEFIKTLNRALSDPRPAVRDFALQATVMKLGRTAPDEAVKIIQARAESYENDEDVAEADRLIGYIEGKRGLVEPWDQMNKLLCRCLVAIAQSGSKTIRNHAISALANTVSFFNYRPDFRLQDGLTASEKKALKNVLDSSLDKSDTNLVSNIHLLNKWIVNK